VSGKSQLRVQQGKAGVRWTRCRLLGYFTYLPPSAGRVRIFCRPFWRWCEGRRYVVIWVGGITAVGAYNGGCLVNWGKMVWKIFKIDDDGDNACGSGTGSRANCSRAAVLLLLGDNSALATLELRARDVETTRQLLWPLSWALAFGLCAAATLVPRSCPATPAHFSQALTTDCIPPHISSLPEHLALNPTSRSPTS